MTRVGFIGLGHMGHPMAMNLARGGTEPTVWNRSPGKYAGLEELRARAVETPAQVFEAADVVFLMLANGAVLDEVLHRGTVEFSELVAGRVVVHMGTTAPSYSHGLARDVAAAGGGYVEAPVSGSRKPAERGELVAMVAGDDERAIDMVTPLLRMMCAQTVRCGRPPAALQMKLAVNTFLITMVTGLAEAFHFADQQGLDRQLLAEILDAGPMASSVSRTKAAKLVADDFAVQAAVADVYYNTRLIFDEARAGGAVTPLLDACRDLFQETDDLGHGRLDMAAVIRAMQARTIPGEAAGWS